MIIRVFADILRSLFPTIVVMLISSLGFAQQTVDELLEIAQEKIAIGDLGYACVIYERAIELDSTQYRLYLNYAAVLNAAEYYEKAFDPLLVLIEKDTLIGKAYNMAGLFYMNARKYGSSYKAYSDAIATAENDEDRGNYFSNRSIVHYRVQDWEEALADLDSANVYLPESVEIINNRALVYSRMDKLNEAIIDYKYLLKVDTNFFFTYDNIAIAYTQLDSLDLALVYFDSARAYLDTIAHAGDAGLYYSNYADVLRRLNRLDEALSSINRSVALYPANSYAYKTMGLIYLAMEKPKEACRAFLYAREQQFKIQYGDEVDELIELNCE